MLNRFSAPLCALVAASALSITSHAQALNDSPTWTRTCSQLSAMSKDIDNGHADIAIVRALSSVSGTTLASVAHERSAAGQHQVACALYYSAAIAEHANGLNGTKAHTDVMMGAVEVKRANGQKLGFMDRIALVNDAQNPPPTAADFALVSQIMLGGSSTPAAPPPGPAAAPVPNPASQSASSGSCSGSDENYARLCQVQQHPSRSGVPSACDTNWAKSGPLSQKCADALWLQAESERKGGDCVNALTDYDNARQAAQNAGSIVLEGARDTNPRSECENKVHPPAPDPRFSGKAGVAPVGRYTCYSAPAVIANGGAYGKTIVQIGQWQGYAYIFNDHTYAGNGDGKDTGTYHMQGNNLIAESGPYKRNNVAATYMAQGVYKRPTLYLQFLDDNGKPIIGLGCTWDGPPAGH